MENVMLITEEQMQELIKQAAEMGAKTALATYQEQKKIESVQRRDKKLRNTKLLLRNYHMLKEHAENSVFGRTQMEESATDILESMMDLYNDTIIIQSIKNSATRTAIIVAHIETMFGLYRTYCENAANADIEIRRYNVVWDMYMAEKTLKASDIASKYNMSKENVYSDLKVATERLTALIFGVDGLKLR